MAVGLLVAASLLSGCGPQVPPAANYATVYGVVVDSASNTPIAGASVTVNVVSTAISDSNGNFRISTIPSGPWQWQAQSPNYRATGDTGPAPLMAGEQRYLSIQLQHS
jgi:hypothetical protein